MKGGREGVKRGIERKRSVCERERETMKDT